MKMLVGGKWVDSVSKETIDIINPATQEIVDTAPRAGKDDVDFIIQAALKGKAEVKEMSIYRRAEIMVNAAEKLKNDKDLARLLAMENGKTLSDAQAEIDDTVHKIIGFSEVVKSTRGYTLPMDTVMPGCETMLGYTIRKPLGIILGIVPFNFPLGCLIFKLAPAFAIGNAFIAKLPEQCPLAALKMGKYFLEAGAPENSMNFVTGFGEEIGEPLAKRPEIDMISFTGSGEVGKLMAAIAGKNLKHVALELSGNDPIVICDDADLDAAVAAIIGGRFGSTSGQICCAIKRAFVQDRIFEEFKEKLVKAVKAVKVGDPLDPETNIGPVISKTAALKIKAQVDQSVAMGARVLCGNEVVNETFVQPTVLDQVTLDMPVLAEEVFGPVIPLYPFKTDEEAIEYANHTEYGLSSSVFSKDVLRALKIANNIEAGTTIINFCGCFRPGNLPFGGFKGSGLGKEDFLNTIHEMTEEKGIAINGVYE